MSKPSLGQLLDAAMDLPADAQRRYLLEHCPDDELRQQVLALLTQTSLDDFLETSAAEVLDYRGGDTTTAETPAEPAVSDKPSDQLKQIGVYSILEQIGVGGMGRVFLAEQTAPVSRRVALKLMKSSYAGPRLVERFLAEGQTMARLDHPNVAHLYDVGTTDDGRPFLVVEHIRGERISTFCDREQLSLRRRLELFLQVCAAVQHSHLNRVLHRDLKPSNVLVTKIDGKPTVKLIDFGIAQYLDPDHQAAESGFSGTPSYMSPEALGLVDDGPPVDTRTDVYSLGVLLVEILTGKRPFMETWTTPEAHEQRQKPDLPSRRYKAAELEEQRILATLRSTTRSRMIRALEIDLDWIARRALAYDRDQRYPSPALLAADIESFLRGEMVHARPPSASYRLSKLLRRHYKAVAVVLLIMMTLVGGLVARTLALAEARAARDEERRLRLKAQEVSDFMANSFIEGARVADPLFGRMVPLTVIHDVRRKADAQLDNKPLVHADVLKALAKIALALKQRELACDIVGQTVELERRHLPADHEDLQEALALWADCPQGEEPPESG